MTGRNTQHNLHAEIQSLLLEYAVGALDEATSLMAASYITIHPEARRYVCQYETVGGMIMESCCDPVSMSAQSLNRVMRCLDDEPRKQKQETSTSQQELSGCEKVPAPIRTYIHSRHVRAKWKKFTPGVQYIILPVDSCDLQAALVRMAPGARVPRHDHEGLEMTLVLDGAFYDDDGRYTPGDLVISENAPAHQPTACNETGCLCFVIAENPVHYKGLMGAVLNLFVR